MKRTNKIQFTQNELKTFWLHTAHMFLEGILDGALLLNEFILIKSLLATDYQISFLFQLSVIPMLLSIVLNQFIKYTKNKKRVLRIVAWMTRLPLIMLLFFPKSVELVAEHPIYASLYLWVFLFYYIYKPVILPAINVLLRENYRPQTFGRLYSYSTSIKKVTVLSSTFIVGLMLNNNPFAFTYIYPALGILGIISIYLITFIKSNAINTHAFNGVIRTLFDSIKGLIHIMKENKPYRDFEIGFLLYGLAWMGTTAVITIFMEKQLHLSYNSVAFYKNTYNLVAIVLLPYFGKVLGNIDPRKFAIITFGSLLLHLLFLILTNRIPLNFNIWGIQLYVMLFISFVFNGLFNASMPLLWGVGSSYFCKQNQADQYQSIHLSLVGFRGLFAPLLGVYILQLFSYTTTFILGISSLILAIFLMIWSYRKQNIAI